MFFSSSLLVRMYIPVSLTCRETHLYIGKKLSPISNIIILSINTRQRRNFFLLYQTDNQDHNCQVGSKIAGLCKTARGRLSAGTQLNPFITNELRNKIAATASLARGLQLYSCYGSGLAAI
jgi:hypothetical protein